MDVSEHHTSETASQPSISRPALQPQFHFTVIYQLSTRLFLSPAAPFLVLFSVTMSSPPASASFTPPTYEWTGGLLDGDILAACAFFFFPLVTFYGRKQLAASITASSCLIVAYTAYILLGYYAHLTPLMEYILLGVAAGATFIAVMAAIDLGVFLLGAAGGALLANLALHFVRLPTEFQHEFLFRLLFLAIPAIALGLATVYLINFLIRPMSAFVGAYFLADSLSHGLSRLGLASSAPFDPPVFFGPLELASDNPAPAFTASLLLSYALLVLWLTLTVVGVVTMYHSEYRYEEIERISVDGKEYRRVNVTDAGYRGVGGGGYGTTRADAHYHAAPPRNAIQDL